LLAECRQQVSQNVQYLSFILPHYILKLLIPSYL